MTGDAAVCLKTERNLRFVTLRAGPDWGDLTIVVDGARVSDAAGPAGTGNAQIDDILGPVRSIEVGPGCLRYTILFRNVVAYAVRDESFANPEPDEDYSSHLRSYTKSRFLDFIGDATIADQMLDDPILHVAVVTLDTVADVASTTPPEIEMTTLNIRDITEIPGRPQEFGGR